MATTYAELEDRAGTIYNKKTGQGYATPAALAKDLGITPHQIKWGSIAKQAAPAAPKGGVPLGPVPSPKGAIPLGTTPVEKEPDVGAIPLGPALKTDAIPLGRAPTTGAVPLGPITTTEVDYTGLENRDGTIYNVRTGQGYTDPTMLATDLGVSPHQIDWSRIKLADMPVVNQLKPTGNIVNDQKITEINKAIQETPGLFTTSVVELIDYSKLEDRDGTIYNTSTGKPYEDPAKLATALGIPPHEIKWDQITKISISPKYENLENREGTIYNRETGEAYETEAQLAAHLDIPPHEISWTEIKEEGVEKVTDYSKYENREGTIYNKETGEGYETPSDLAEDLGIEPSDIDWGQIEEGEEPPIVIDTKEAEDVQALIDEAVRKALEARDNEDYEALKTSMEDLKTAKEKQQTIVDQLYEDQKKFREQYLASLKPTPLETDLKFQLTDVRAGIEQTVLNAQAGISKVTGQPIPQAFVTGQAKAIADAANLTLQSQAAQEKNLIDRLGIEVEDRAAMTDALKVGLGFIGDDMNMQMKIQIHLDNKEQSLLDRFDDYDDTQKKDAVDILTSLSGINPATFSSETLVKLAQIANQRGIGLQDILSGLQLEFDKESFNKAKREKELEPDTTLIESEGRILLVNAATGETIRDIGAVEEEPPGTTIIERDGRQILINSETGEDIKDLGAIEVEAEVDANVGKTQKVGDDVFMWNTATQAYDIPVGTEPGQISEADAANIRTAKDKIDILNTALYGPHVTEIDDDTPIIGAIDEMTGTSWYAVQGIKRAYFYGKTQDTIAKVEQMLSAETMAVLIDLKSRGGALGALSDRERQMLDSAASTLGTAAMHHPDTGKTYGYRMTKEAFITEIKKLKEVARRKVMRLQGIEFDDETGKIIDKPTDDDPEGLFSKVGGDTNLATKKEGTKFGQCGRFVNSITGLGVGDSYASKMAKMDKSIKTPEAGMVFLMPYETTGHVGFILSIDDKGIATVKDSNWSLDEKIKVHTIDTKKMTGFAHYSRLA